ncbi:hypothetical protein C1646_773961 [Rhizophagus diaphanus]|nr:hypothetical protein C1646_773961 [Rhizophagus diaphanus] [Rhizophagus sp. MUCL 43196]
MNYLIITELRNYSHDFIIKLPALFIHKYQTPRDLIVIDKSKLPTKTGILSSIITSLSPADDNLNEIEEIQKLLEQYGNFTFGELISAEEFILIDDDDNYEEKEITDEDIINIVKSNEIDLAEEKTILQPKISTLDVLVSLDKVLSFLNNPPDNFIIELNNRNLLHNLKKQIILFDKNSRVQSGRFM